MTVNKTYKLSAHKACQYNVRWQALRVSFLGKWNSVEGTKDNLRRLTLYLERGGVNITKIWRALNLCNATVMGYNGQGLGASPQAQQVTYYKEMLSGMYHARKGKEPIAFDTPTEIKEDWDALDPRWQKAILADLEKRLDRHRDSEHRDDLRWFIDIVKGEYVDVWTD